MSLALERIFCFLSRKALVKCCYVCKEWNELANRVIKQGFPALERRHVYKAITSLKSKETWPQEDKKARLETFETLKTWPKAISKIVGVVDRHRAFPFTSEARLFSGGALLFCTYEATFAYLPTKFGGLVRIQSPTYKTICFLSDQFIIGHCLDLQPEDIELFGDSGFGPEVTVLARIPALAASAMDTGEDESTQRKQVVLPTMPECFCLECKFSDELLHVAAMDDDELVCLVIRRRVKFASGTTRGPAPVIPGICPIDCVVKRFPKPRGLEMMRWLVDDMTQEFLLAPRVHRYGNKIKRHLMGDKVVEFTTFQFGLEFTTFSDLVYVDDEYTSEDYDDDGSDTSTDSNSPESHPRNLKKDSEQERQAEWEADLGGDKPVTSKIIFDGIDSPKSLPFLTADYGAVVIPQSNNIIVVNLVHKKVEVWRWQPEIVKLMALIIRLPDFQYEVCVIEEHPLKVSACLTTAPMVE